LVCGLYGALQSVTVLRRLRHCRDIIITYMHNVNVLCKQYPVLLLQQKRNRRTYRQTMHNAASHREDRMHDSDSVLELVQMRDRLRPLSTSVVMSLSVCNAECIVAELDVMNDD